jgi:hypothetical protein
MEGEVCGAQCHDEMMADAVVCALAPFAPQCRVIHPESAMAFTRARYANSLQTKPLFDNIAGGGPADKHKHRCGRLP